MVVDELQADIGAGGPREAAAEFLGDGKAVFVGAVAEFVDPHPDVRYLPLLLIFVYAGGKSCSG